MCNGQFLNKSPDDALTYFDSLAENAQNWDTSSTTVRIKSKPLATSRPGMYVLSEEDDLNAKIASLPSKVDAIQKPNVVKVADSVEHACGICESLEHYTKDCPTIPAFQEVLHDQANSIDAYKRPFSSPYSETYNPNWRNHPNFSWRNGPTMNGLNVPQGLSSSNPYVPPHKNNLEDTLQTFVQGQTQINQNVMKTLDELKTSIVRIEPRLNVREKGTLPAQTQPNPKGQFEVKNSNLEQANVFTTLRSGKVIETPMKVNEPEKSVKPKGGDCHSDTENENSDVDKKMHAQFPHRLLSTKQLTDNKDILDVFQQVKINIPLLSVIKQVPAYAKFLKDLCTVKRKHNVHKKAFLTEQEKASRLEAKVPLEACLPNLLDLDENGCIEEVNSLLNSSMLLETDKWQSRFESLQISETEPLPPSVEFPKPDLNRLPNELDYDVLGQNGDVQVLLPFELNDEQKTMHSHVVRKHISAADWSIADMKGIDPSISAHRKSQLNELHEIRNREDTNCKCKMKLCFDKHAIRETVEPVLCYDSHLQLFSNKLKSQWKDPFNVKNEFRDCTVGIQNPNNINIFKVNVQLLKPVLELVNPEVDTTALEDPSYA
ncbi:uncharacterized protein LOC113296342 [Papaver somniferum]|uniref:uncharacterized protein LOC113296342 n=1 Tax=Papaver somniferum TaxID=3469 RepID=UPI000E6FDD9C|nr:uncharacterized protein LOC113296342 [Papaver somniferum]